MHNSITNITTSCYRWSDFFTQIINFHKNPSYKSTDIFI